MDLVNSRPNLHRTVAGCLVQAMCQWTGVNVNNYFGPTIYNALGYGGTSTLLISGISGVWGSLCTFIFITFLGQSFDMKKMLVLMNWHSRQDWSKDAAFNWCCWSSYLVSQSLFPFRISLSASSSPHFIPLSVRAPLTSPQYGLGMWNLGAFRRQELPQLLNGSIRYRRHLRLLHLLLHLLRTRLLDLPI